MLFPIFPLILICRVILAPIFLALQTSFPVGIVFFVLSLFPVTHPGLLALFSGAILLILFHTGITWYRFTTVKAGNCWNHCENLSKLKDADFQQLTINLFYLIIIAGFQSKRAQFLL
jgi:hypothetical protein